MLLAVSVVRRVLALWSGSLFNFALAVAAGLFGCTGDAHSAIPSAPLPLGILALPPLPPLAAAPSLAIRRPLILQSPVVHIAWLAPIAFNALCVDVHVPCKRHPERERNITTAIRM